MRAALIALGMTAFAGALEAHAADSTADWKVWNYHNLQLSLRAPPGVEPLIGRGYLTPREGVSVPRVILEFILPNERGSLIAIAADWTGSGLAPDLDGVVAGMGAVVEGKELDVQPVAWPGGSGRDFTVKGGKRPLRGRMLFLHGRAYQFLAFGPEGLAAPPAEAEDFIAAAAPDP